MDIISLFLGWRARFAPASFFKRPAADEFGCLLPYANSLDPLAARYCVWRVGAESTPALARRAAMAICEAIELKTQEIKDMEADLQIVLEHDRWPSCE